MSSPVNLLSALENYISLSGAREQTIAENMANVDTPGYHTRDIDFDHELQRAMHRVTFEGSQAETAHFSPVSAEVKGLMERPDGNNVDLDRESMLLAQTQLQNEMAVQLIKHHFHSLLSAINGGS
jgi:flagellar basal-body rod protein FlgB